MNKKLLRWFAIGLALTLMAVGFSGNISVLAQEIVTHSTGETEVSDISDSRKTDDPLGRFSIPIENELSAYTDSNAYMEILASDSSTQIGSDDPQGRNLINPPEVQIGSGVNNQALNESLSTTELLPPSDDQIIEGPLAPEAVLGQTKVLVIPAADFRNDRGDNCYFFPFLDGNVYGSYQCWMMAPVYLPDHAVISWMYASVIDNSATEDFYATLYRVDNYSGVVNTILTLNTTGQSTLVQNIYDDIASYTTIGWEWSYYIGMAFHSSAIKLYSVRIWY